MKNRNIQFKPTLGLLIPVLLVCFALPPAVQAVVPAPDGGYGPPNYGTGNTAEGQNALLSLTSGTYNTAVGLSSLRSLTTGKLNTATGAAALFANTADGNTATGASALFNNTTGYHNTANGAFALFNNTNGSVNTAYGYKALFTNNGSGNTAIGDQALYHNITADDNTANGTQALYSNTTGEGNTATGSRALTDNTSGDSNTASGLFALANNTTGSDNTASGTSALIANTTGSNNTAIGRDALPQNNGSNNVGLGKDAGRNLTTGSGNVCIGQGVLGLAGENNTTRIRNVYSSVASARAVYVTPDNKIGTVMSSRRFKDEIRPMDKASETILALKPVTFRYKKEIEPNGAMMFGLIAEEVEKVAPDLVTRNDKGEVETVRYDAVNAMLLNEFLKEHRKNEQQEVTIAELKSGMAALTTMVKEQASQIQKANARLEMSTLQVAENNH